MLDKSITNKEDDFYNLTLKRHKDEVKEVQSGQECGMAFEKYEDIRESDVIEIFTTEEIERTL